MKPSNAKNTRGIPENAEKCLQAIPANSWPLSVVMGLQVNQFFARGCCIRSKSVRRIKFDRKMSCDANDQAKVLRFAALHDHGWGYVAVYPS